MKNHLLELDQEMVDLEDSEQFLNKIKDNVEKMKFGEGVSFTKLFNFYGKVYTFFYDPIVMKCHILLVKGLQSDDLKTKMKRYVNSFYKQIDDIFYDDIKEIYDCSMESKLVQLYDTNINLTSTVPSLLLNYTVPDTNEGSFVTLNYVHIGMCVFTVLKHYIYNVEIIPPHLFDKLKELLSERVEIEPIINEWYDEYIGKNEKKCDIVLFEHCETLYRDPMYCFWIEVSEYSKHYNNIQLDYYNTCESIGYGKEDTYNREDAVKTLDNDYYRIAEHYILDNNLAKIYQEKGKLN